VSLGRKLRAIGTAIALPVLAVVSDDATGQQSVPAAKRMVMIGASYAQDWGNPVLPGYTIINKGVSGETSAKMLGRFDTDVVAAKPQVVLIWGHINDIFRAPNGDFAAAAANARRNHVAMIDRAKSAGIEVILATEVTLPEPEGLKEWVAGIVQSLRGKKGYQERVNEQVRAVNAFLRDYAKRNSIRLLDFEQTLDGGDGFRNRQFTTEDGTHISAAGYQALSAYTSRQIAGKTN
jgi:lysophospholipase L1-like esterase